MHTAIEKFQKADAFARLSKNAQRRHRVVLRVLLKVVGNTTPIARLTSEHIDAVLADRRDRGVMDSTINSYKQTLRIFATWAFQKGLTPKEGNVATGLKNVKTVTPKRKRKPITRDQTRELFRVAGERHPRDRALCALLIYSGCRSSEITGLTWDAVDLTDGTLEVYRPKVRDYLRVVAPAELAAELQKWRAWYEENTGPIQPGWYVVPALKAKGFDADGVPYRMSADWSLSPQRRHTMVTEHIKAFLGEIGVADLHGKGAHTLRRTSANLILEASGGDIRAVQHLLGHKSVAVTESYLDVDAAALKYGAVIRGWEI